MENELLLELIDCGELATEIELYEYYSSKDEVIEKEETDGQYIYIVVHNHYYDFELRNTYYIGAFNSYEEAKCFIRKMKQEYCNNSRCKIYGFNDGFHCVDRDNKKCRDGFFIKSIPSYL